MKLVKTAPHREFTTNGTTYHFPETGELWLPDAVASALPKTVYSIVSSKADEEAPVEPPAFQQEAGSVEDVLPEPSVLEKETSDDDDVSASDIVQPSDSDTEDTGQPSSTVSPKGKGKKKSR